MRCVARRTIALSLLALGAVAAVPWAASADAEDDSRTESFEEAAPRVKRLLESDKPADRLKGFSRAGQIKDPRALDVVLDGLVKENARLAALKKAQAEVQTLIEGALTDVERANQETPRSAREMEEYNRRVRKIEQKRDTLFARQRGLATDAMQQKAIFVSAAAAAAGVIDSLPADVAKPLVDRLTAAWNGPKSPVADRIRWVDVIAAVHSLPVSETLRAVALDTAADSRVRVAALAARASRVDDGVIPDCVKVLEEPPERWAIISAAIDSMRRLHRKEAIEPLIAFLGKPDLGRLRDDAWRALRSLTGEKHGPYMQPWRDWWRDAKATFRMPEKPSDVLELLRPDRAATFYGITTSSDRILFVLDVSGSMLDPAHPNAAGARRDERKIDLSRKELVGTITTLDPKKTFDVIFFNHKVVRFLGVMTAASPAVVERTRRFATELEPSGGTNIHDSLEAAFSVAGVTSGTTIGSAAADTIFFMTDGTPTAGKIQHPDQILDVVRDWNRTAQITIHVIALGEECDDKFLEALATQNNGQFVKR